MSDDGELLGIAMKALMYGGLRLKVHISGATAQYELF